MHPTDHRSAILMLWALVISSFMAVGNAWGEPNELATLLKKYEAHVAQVLAPVDDKLGEDLKTFESLLAEDGKLEAAIEIKEARLGLALKPEGQSPDPGAFPLEVAAFCKKYPEAAETLGKVRKAHIARTTKALQPGRQTLVAELAKLEKKLSTSDRLKQALAVKQQRETVELDLAWGSVKAEIPEGAVEWSGHRYYMFEEKMTWQAAKEYCEGVGGHLASITSQEENSVILGLSRKQNCWLGATDEVKEGKWKWVTGEPFEYSKWHKRPDNHKGKQHYLFYWVGRGWDDTYATDKYRFICEWEPPNS